MAHAQVARPQGPFGSGPEPGPAKGIRYIDGEYKVIEAESDAARRDRALGNSA